MKITKSRLLQITADAVADRGLNYGLPEDNFNNIARLWNAYQTNKFGAKPDLLRADDIANMMILMKVARLSNQSNHLDSWTDVAGYAACGANICCEEPNPR